MNEITTIINTIKKFNDERDWEQFHNPKDLAISISVEANELLECFLWKNPDDADISKIKEELADVLILAFQMAYKCGLNIEDIMNEKIALHRRAGSAVHIHILETIYLELSHVVILFTLN